MSTIDYKNYESMERETNVMKTNKWYVMVYCNGKWCGGSHKNQPRNWIGALAAGIVFTIECYISRRDYYGFAMYYWTINRDDDSWFK